ncbi:hypothetical protein [Nocardia wallacei]|uniref:hypothetical protein n=2 Tax=Nocardia wallacei TaxID=480035 RepID=UPI002457155D|nr:hypothetical protein [Nocardia wallacei]
MSTVPAALGWVHPESPALEWDMAQVRRLAQRLGYVLVWAPEYSRIPLADQVRAVGAEVVIAPHPEHFDVRTLNAVMSVADIETVCPRLSFARWASSPHSGGPIFRV